jgi:hypothetical protein
MLALTPLLGSATPLARPDTVSPCWLWIHGLAKGNAPVSAHGDRPRLPCGGSGSLPVWNVARLYGFRGLQPAWCHFTRIAKFLAAISNGVMAGISPRRPGVVVYTLFASDWHLAGRARTGTWSPGMAAVSIHRSDGLMFRNLDYSRLGPGQLSPRNGNIQLAGRLIARNV